MLDFWNASQVAILFSFNQSVKVLPLFIKKSKEVLNRRCVGLEELSEPFGVH